MDGGMEGWMVQGRFSPTTAALCPDTARRTSLSTPLTSAAAAPTALLAKAQSRGFISARVSSVGGGVSAARYLARLAHLEPPGRFSGPTHSVCHRVVMEMPNRSQTRFGSALQRSHEDAKNRDSRVSYNTKHYVLRYKSRYKSYFHTDTDNSTSTWQNLSL